MKSSFLKVLLVFVALALSGAWFAGILPNFPAGQPNATTTEQSTDAQAMPTAAVVAVIIDEQSTDKADESDRNDTIATIPPTSIPATPATPATIEVPPTATPQPAAEAEPPTETEESNSAIDQSLALVTELFTNNGTTQGAEEVEADALDGTLIINKIDLTSGIVTVPVVDNTWPVDDLGQDVGLLEGGGRFPKDEKAMIFAGHATTFWPILGPFAGIDELLPNDEIVYIYNNEKYTYQISRLLLAEPDQISILNSDNGDQIILVTCGQYNYYEGSFERRLVVLADLIDVQPISFN